MPAPFAKSYSVWRQLLPITLRHDKSRTHLKIVVKRNSEVARYNRIIISYRVDVDIILKAHYMCEIVIKLHGLNKELRVCVGIVNGVTHAVSGGGGEVQQWWKLGPHGVVSQEVYVRWRRGGAAVVEGGATQCGVTGGVTHAMSGEGGEVQQWWRVGPHGVVSQEV